MGSGFTEHDFRVRVSCFHEVSGVGSRITLLGLGFTVTRF